MLLNPELLSALNKQLNQELRNAYLYLAMAAYFDGLSLEGFAHYFKVQAREEVEHALKIYQFIVDRGQRVELDNVVLEKKNWSSVLEAVRDFYEAEKSNTQRIWSLVDLARRTGDKAAEAFLQWFVNEQVEEEKSAMDLLAKVEMLKDNVVGILNLDRILAERK
ncbi:MAG: ferritin [Desulfurococcaceae archaeon]